MGSVIADMLRDAEEIHLLVDLDFGGLRKRYSDTQIDVPKERVTNLLSYTNVNSNWLLENPGAGYLHYSFIAAHHRFISNINTGSGATATEQYSTSTVDNRQDGRSIQFNITNDGTSYADISIWSSASYNDIHDIDEASDYSVSFDVWAQKAHTFQIDFRNENTAFQLKEFTTEPYVWKRIELTWNVYASDFAGTRVQLYFGNAGTGIVKIDRIQVEKKATASSKWVPTLGGKRTQYSYSQYSFDAKVVNIGAIRSSFDINNFKYALQNVPVTIINPYTASKDERLQDAEALRVLDGSPGNIYVWCPGLSWEDIQRDGLLFRGVFQKNEHDSESYSFNLVDMAESKFLTIPNNYITEETFPYFRSSGGAGSVGGNEQQIIFGDWPKGVPLDCVNTVSNHYLISSGKVSSVTESLFYPSATEYLYNSDGTTYSWTASGVSAYTGIDGLGNLYSYVAFGSNQAASEQLSCSMQGLTISGSTLIEHPADIIDFLLTNYSSMTTGQLDTASLVGMKNIVPGMKYNTLINSKTSCAAIVDRLLNPTLCARVNKPGGKVGVMSLDFNAKPVFEYDKDLHNIGDRIRITKSPFNLVCNSLTVKYGLNVSTGKYEKSLHRNRNNHILCKLSELEYGKLAEVVLNISDTWNENTAAIAAGRYLSFYSHRHDMVEWEVSWADGFDVREGDMVLLTLPEGTSLDGEGYQREKFILLEREFGPKSIHQLLWRVRVNMDYQIAVDSTSSEVLFGGEEAILGGEPLTW